MEEEESCFLTLCFLLTRYAPHRRVRTYTHTTLHHVAPDSPFFFVVPVSAALTLTLTHTQAAAGGARGGGGHCRPLASRMGSEGGRAAKPLRHPAPAGRGGRGGEERAEEPLSPLRY